MATKAKPDNGAFKALKADLKAKTPGRLYLFYGEEAYLRDYYLGRLQAVLLPPGTETFNLKTLEGKSCTARDIVQAADCLPMMAPGTLVVVTDYDLYKAPEGDREQLLALFSDLPEYLCLVFVYDLLPYKADGRSKLAAAWKQYGQVVEFPRQSQGDLVDWVARRFKATGHDIDSETARYLIFLCGDLMHTLAGEIEKIGAYAKANRVTRKDIDAVATPQLDAVVFTLTDALSAKDFDKALVTLGELVSLREAPTMLLAVIAKHLRQLYAARVALERHRDQEALAKLWGMHPYPAGKLMAAARRVDLAWCRRALALAAQTDAAMKTSYGDETALLTQLVLELAHG